MPAAPDHYRFARGRLSTLFASAPSPLTSAMCAHQRLALMGAQGPDPFFFYGLVPWRHRRKRDRERAADFAAYLHAVDPIDIFPALVSRARLLGDAAIAFSYGMLLHYLLDRAVHPYVFCRSGFDEWGELSGRYGVFHARFETAMASRAEDPNDADSLRPEHLFAAVPADLAVAGRVVAEAFPDRIEASDYGRAWNDMRSILRLLWDPSGVKHDLAAACGFADSMAAAMIWPRRVGSAGSLDYRNNARREWRHPVSGESSTASVAEMIEAAAFGAVQVESLLASAESADGGPDCIARWHEIFQAINHEGHEPGERMFFQDTAFQ